MYNLVHVTFINFVYFWDWFMEQVYGTGFRLKYVTVRGDIQSSRKLTVSHVP